MTSEDPALSRTKLLFRLFALCAVLAWIAANAGVAWGWAAGVLALGAIVLGVLVLIRVARHRQPRLLAIGAVSGLLVSVLLVGYGAVTLLFGPQVSRFEGCARHAITETAKGQCQKELQDGLLGRR